MTKTAHNHDAISRLLRYEAETGRIYRLGWIYHSSKFIAYDQPRSVDGLNALGYVQVRIGSETFLGHRLAWFLTHGKWPEVIDHINGDRADNRLANLRNVTQAENVQNQRRPKSNSTTGYLGVSFDKERAKYVAAVGIGGKRKVIGRFDTAEAAYQAYVERKRELHSTSTL